MESVKVLNDYLSTAVRSFTIKDINTHIASVEKELSDNDSTIDGETVKLLSEASATLARLELICKTLSKQYHEGYKEKMESLCNKSTERAEKKRKLDALAAFMKAQGLNAEDLASFINEQQSSSANNIKSKSSSSGASPVIALDTSKGKESNTMVAATGISKMNELEDFVVEKYLANRNIANTDVELKPVIQQLAKDLNKLFPPANEEQKSRLVILLTMITCRKDMPLDIKQKMRGHVPFFSRFELVLSKTSMDIKTASRISSSIIDKQFYEGSKYYSQLKDFISSEEEIIEFSTLLQEAETSKGKKRRNSSCEDTTIRRTKRKQMK